MVIAITAILLWQLITFVIFFITNENEDILVYLACGIWLFLWNKTMLSIMKIKRKIKKRIDKPNGL